MKTYYVYFRDGEQVTIEADDFSVDYDLKRVVFKVQTSIVAIFMLDGIAGFKKID